MFEYLLLSFPIFIGFYYRDLIFVCATALVQIGRRANENDLFACYCRMRCSMCEQIFISWLKKDTGPCPSCVSAESKAGK